MAAPAMVLSFARGRARHVARELVDLEFRLDVEQITASGAIRLVRTERDQLRRALEQRLALLATLAEEMHESDALRGAIFVARAAYERRGAIVLGRSFGLADPEIVWARALFALEQIVVAKKIDQRAR